MKRPGEETLIRYFLGKCDPDEQKVVSAYLALKIDEEYVEACLREAFDVLEDGEDPTKEQQARDRVWGDLVAKQQQPTVIRLKPRMRWYRYAAVIAFLILSGSVLFLLKDKIGVAHQQLVWQHIEGTIGRPKTVTLDDSTSVTLFPGSAIDIPSDFNGKDRNVRLNGRAFFKVAHHKEKPFYVTANGLTTKVLGTSFEVNSAERENIITLHTGKISVSHADKEIARLSPNQQMKYQLETGKYNVAAVDAAGTLNWVQGELDYNRVPLQTIITDIEKWYAVKIQIVAPSILDQKVIFSFREQSLDRVLTLLSKSANFSYEIKGKHIMIKERNMDTD